MSYTRVTEEERKLIYRWKQEGKRRSKIAQLLGRNKSTISRELERNKGERGYRPQQAHIKALMRTLRPGPRRFTEAVRLDVEEKLGMGWTPEMICGRLPGSAYALDKWDMLLSDGRRIWGYANDDSHAGAVESGLGWNVAYAYERSVDSVVEALRNGRFYASTGVSIKAIEVDGVRIRVEADNADRLVAVREDGKRFAVVDENWIEIEVPEDAGYVRFECYGRGEQIAWTQPFFVEKEAGE